MEITSPKTTDSDAIVMCVYGQPKTGKTTFAASTALHGKTWYIGFENGSKYLGQRGFTPENGYDLGLTEMKDWFNKEDVDFLRANLAQYDFIVVDPMGEAMEKLMTGDRVRGAKYRQQDGSLTMAGWGEVKKHMRSFIKFLRDSGKTVVLVFHDDRFKKETEMHHTLMLPTKLKEEIPGMVDIISYIGVSKKNDKNTRVMYTPAQGGNFDSGDRTGRVPETIEISEADGWGDFIRALKPIPKPEPKQQPEKTKAEEMNDIADKAFEGV